MSEISFQDALKKQDIRFYNIILEKSIVDDFSKSLDIYASKVNNAVKNKENEEYFKKIVNSFLEENFYNEENYEINTRGKIDSAIMKNGKILCIIETKTPMNKEEMLENSNINKKALHELIYYYLEETRDVTGTKIKYKLDSQIRTLIATNSAKFFIFPSEAIESIVRGEIEEYYFKFKNNLLNVSKTANIYDYLKSYLSSNNVLQKIEYVYFDMGKIKKETTKIPYLYKILSKFYLLKEKYYFQSSSHTLNQKFYNELLYIMGLSEQKKDNVKYIKIDNSIENSIAYQVYNRFINKEDKSSTEAEDKTFELIIIWLNRILFIKLFESQLMSFNGNDNRYRILDLEKIKSFDDLDEVFFNVLGKTLNNRRNDEFYKKFENIPYLNSSLFERQQIEIEGINISELSNKQIKLKKDSILISKQLKEMPILDYLLNFLNCYDFSSKEVEKNIKIKGKDIIDSSVLGLIFEKINGYKDGSVYTPSQITEYMAKIAVEKNVIKRINKELNLNCEDLQSLRFEIQERHDKDVYTKVNDIINTITYCDPAVGSGHFLVSVLNRIIYTKFYLGVLLYNDNKEPVREFNIYIEDDTLIIEDGQGNYFNYEKNNKLSQRLQETLFNEKKNIIEKCLFGADLNTKAVYICQLRLWIELLKNAYYKNNVMQTLPNIDINIKSGNSLINKIKFCAGEKIELSKQANIDSRVGIIQKYKKVVRDYINESDKAKKNELKKVIREFNDFYIHDKQTSMFQDVTEDQKLYENCLEWSLEYPEIITELKKKDKSDVVFLGFDCIIGNPPYIQLQSMKKECEKLEKMQYQVFSKMGDIYCLFFELAKKLVKKDGLVAFITSNKWMKAGYGEKLRNFLLTDFNPTLLIDFGGIKVFDEATVDTDILLLENNNYKDNTITCKIKENCLNNLDDYIEHNKNLNEFKIDSTWNITSDIENSIKDKIEKYGTKLKNWNIKINYGIKTGCNEAFIIDEETKNRLISEDPKSAEIIRPILRGRDIKRYSYTFSNLWLICTFPSKHYEIEEYPAIKKYLLSFGIEYLEQSGKKYIIDGKEVKSRKKTNNKWFETQDSINYSDDFYKQKLVWTSVNSEYKFCIVPENIFINNSLFMITGDNLEILCAYLNSKLYRFYFKMLLSNGNYAYGSQEFFKNVPILLKCDYENEILEAFKEIDLNIYNINKITTKIDNFIYKAYNLTNDEILYIEKNIN